MGNEQGRGGGNGNGQQRPGGVDVSSELQLPSGPVRSPAEGTQALTRAVDAGAILLAPRTAIGEIPVGYELLVRAVRFPTGGGKEANGKWSNGVWYTTDGGGLALHRSSLDQLAQLAGISSVPDACRVVEMTRYCWKATHTVRVRDLNGTWRTAVGNRIVDARGPNADLSIPQGDKLLRTLREHGPAQAESKARNRAIRAALGIRGSYTPEEANRPFVCPVLQWKPDMSDPIVRQMVAASELGITDRVYGPREPQAPALTSTVDPDVLDLMDDNSDERPRGGRDPGDEPLGKLDERDRPQPRDQGPGASQGPTQRDSGPAQRLTAHPDDDPRFAGRETQRALAPRDAQPSLLPGKGGGGQTEAQAACAVCTTAIDADVAAYSQRNFGDHLCNRHWPQRGGR